VSVEKVALDDPRMSFFQGLGDGEDVSHVLLRCDVLRVAGTFFLQRSKDFFERRHVAECVAYLVTTANKNTGNDVENI
jgi:hypothetical protein